MSDYGRRSYNPKARPAPIIINREPNPEPEVRFSHLVQEGPKQRPRSLTFGEKLYNLFHPSSRTKKVVVVERSSRRRKQKDNHLPGSPPLPTTPPTAPPPPNHTRRHSASPRMPEPQIPLPPRIIPDAQPPRPTGRRQESPDTIRPIVEERAPNRRTRVYPNPLEPRERVVDPPPVTFEVNQPVHRRPRRTDNAQELAQARADTHRLSLDLEQARTRVEELQRMLAHATRTTEHERQRAAQLEAKLASCQHDRQLLERQARVGAGEAQLERQKTAQAMAELEQIRQNNSKDRGQRVAPRPTTVVQNYRPAEPRNLPRSPSMDAILQAREDNRREGYNR
jgi:hypothetical protein